jgi:hypothetical protein
MIPEGPSDVGTGIGMPLYVYRTDLETDQSKILKEDLK